MLIFSRLIARTRLRIRCPSIPSVPCRRAEWAAGVRPRDKNTSYQHIKPGFAPSDAADPKKRATEIFPDNSI